MDIKLKLGRAAEEEQLAKNLEKLFLEEWGGPKSTLALAFLNETVIPALTYVLSKNWQFLDNPTFSDILTTKLNSQFAYPPVFAQA
ncbi:hypothetical protein N752_14210 [Desulforamulus aquiferis]|nr:hypothetical protein [Desulforamulus aquiferis]RYD04523.1 hypothetical protein N752_14210 [Desulforamulus aquiferis]